MYRTNTQLSQFSNFWQYSSVVTRWSQKTQRPGSNIFGDWCFAAAGPRLWNSLPINLRLCHSLEQFQHLLKTFLFSAWSHGALWHLPNSAPYINLLTYLLTVWMHRRSSSRQQCSVRSETVCKTSKLLIPHAKMFFKLLTKCPNHIEVKSGAS